MKKITLSQISPKVLTLVYMLLHKSNINVAMESLRPSGAKLENSQIAPKG